MVLSGIPEYTSRSIRKSSSLKRGRCIFPDGSQTTEGRQFGRTEVKQNMFVLDGRKFKKCDGLLFFCCGCDNFAHGKRVVLFFVFSYYKYNTYFSDFQMVTENPYLFYE